MTIKDTGRIARRNVRIMFQTIETISDEYRNRIQSWTDYFECSAYANTYAQQERKTKEIFFCGSYILQELQTLP